MKSNRIVFALAILLSFFTLTSETCTPPEEKVENVGFSNVSFVHQTTAYRKTHARVGGPVAYPTTVDPNPKGSDSSFYVPKAGMDFIGEGGTDNQVFGNESGQHQELKIGYRYTNVDSVHKTFWVKEELVVLSCIKPDVNTNSYLKGTRKFSFDIVIPTGNNYQIAFTAAESNNDNPKGAYAFTLTDSNGKPADPNSAAPGSYKGTIEGSVDATWNGEGAHVFYTEKTFDLVFIKK